MINKIVIYVPALNEEETISEVLLSIPKKYNDINEVTLLVVNDGSTDDTVNRAKESGATVISHTQNRGVGKAFQTAVNYALKVKADILVSIDADGQFDVNQIPEMIQPIIEKQADFCIGNRFSNSLPEKMPKIKYWGNKKISKIISFISNTKIQDASCGFRAYSKDCLYSLNLQGMFTYTHETILELLQKGFGVAQVPVRVTYYDDRVSKIANSLTSYTIKTSIIIFKCFKDYKPLKFFLSIALFVFLVALLIGGFVLVHWLNTGMITPYKSFGFISLSLCGMALLIATLALIADMLNRIRENQEKILYLTKKKYFEQN